MGNSGKIQVLLSVSIASAEAYVFYRVPEGAEDFAAVFAEERRRKAIAHRRAGETDGIGDAPGGAQGRVFELNDQISRSSLRVVERSAFEAKRESVPISSCTPRVNRNFFQSASVPTPTTK